MAKRVGWTIVSGSVAAAGIAGGLFLSGSPAPAAPPAAAPETFEVDTVHSVALFRILHAQAAPFWGRINGLTGTFTFDPAAPAAATIALELPADGIDTADPKRDQHLKLPDFFDAKQFPTLSFKSTKVEPLGTDKLKVTGDLTMHGITKSVEAEATMTGASQLEKMGPRRGFEAILTIQRADFGITYGKGALGDDVRLVIGVEGVKK